MRDYDAIGNHSSTEELNHLELVISNQQDFKLDAIFNREPMQCWQNQANMVTLHFGPAGVCLLSMHSKALQ